MIGEENKIVASGAFIPAAERYNFMSTIDKWVINEIFRLLQELNKFNDDNVIYELSINLSGTTICELGLKEYIIEKQNQYNIDAKHICFEVTETSAVANLNDATILIKELKNSGFKFSLDDFGSGKSSFTYLKVLDVDFLKIDGSFVRDIEHDEVDLAMVEFINHTGQVMGMFTVAEFVENDAILLFYTS
ncbi:diguanylate cyclase/phosphodiesterase (GGDEF & EAL domains) with PAS/PAC sensor(s) [hydrothermal vent metagenome]|uniref:Diguanylate cyclase/phosphodiesterase (GGDEF & EAL domains) with PAS/PAC sensor(S) n=1 Tax=hydrothermal vent metagenome TaxID=652676 RepID=A0A3B1AEN5_9ZZZZ